MVSRRQKNVRTTKFTKISKQSRNSIFTYNHYLNSNNVPNGYYFKMKKFKSKEQLKNYRRFHIPGCGNLMSVKTNVISINKHNSREHEGKKLDLAWDSQLFITEAARSASEEEVKIFNLKKKTKIVDFVDLISMKEFEIIHKHETDIQIQFYRKTGVIPIIINPMTCVKCNLIYPERNKKHICQICRGENGKKENKYE